LPGIPDVVGRSLESALKLLGGGKTITVETTSTPFDDKKLERQDKEPVVICQKELDSKIILTVSQFK
jgi:hypothetical protein